MMQMLQGDSYALPISIAVDGGVADNSCFADVEICVGALRKTIAANEIKYDTARQVFLFPLTQEETMAMSYKQLVQVRVKLKDSGNVIGVDLGQINVGQSISKVVL